MTLILFSAPFSSHTHTHTQTSVSLATRGAFVSEKNRRFNLLQERMLGAVLSVTQTILSIQGRPHRPLLPPSAVFAHAVEEGRVRDNLADTGVHKDAARNKQADVSNEVGGFEGIWVILLSEALTGRLSGSITDADEGD